MKPDDNQQAIRAKARERFREESFDVDMENADVRKLVQELRIHQIELELQNEELRQAQQRLSEVAEQYSDLYDFAPVGYLTLDSNAIIRRINLTAANMLGSPRKKLLNKPLIIRVPAGCHAGLNTLIRSVLAGKEFPPYELEIKRPDGKRLWVALVSSLDVSSKSEPLCRATLTDITVLKETERALRESEEEIRKFKMLAENATYGVLIADLKGNVTYANAALAAMHGYQPGELLGASLSILYSDDNPMQVASGAQDYGGFGAREMACLRKDGTEFNVLLNCTLVRDDTGAPLFLAMTATDITEFKSLQAQLQQAQKMEAIGQLAGGIAHDFNNLLTVIINRADFVQEALPAYSIYRDDLREIIDAGTRGAALIRQLLAFSRRQYLSFKRLDMNNIIRGVEKMLNRLIGEDIRLTIKLHRDTCITMADAGQLEQVIINLAVNARDAMPNGGMLTVETRPVVIAPADSQSTMEADNPSPGHYIGLFVTDTGVGMSKALQARIFDPFFTTKEVGQGTGLGLSTVYGIVKQHKGFIRVYSEPAKGTTFRILLPAQDNKPRTDGRVDKSVTLPRGNETILLVEDEAGVRSISARMLRDLGYHILEAENGKKALDYLQNCADDISLLLTDVVMPELDGKQLAEQAIKLKPSLKIIFTSGYPEAHLKLRNAWVTDHLLLQKPFLLSELASSIRKALDS